jgi:mono/diheme cytochrome c family protein
MRIRHTPGMLRKTCAGSAALMMLVVAGLSPETSAQNQGSATATSHPTYAADVASIINENCVVCHREGGIAPMQLTNYEQVRPWAPLIEDRVVNRKMPPYSYDHGIGIQDLQGDWRLSQQDIDTIVAWVEQGAPSGNLNEIPAMPDLPDLAEWNFADQFGQPDIVLASNSIDVPASGNDLWDIHFVDSGLTADRCIKAVQVKPRGDAKSVVHHANTYFAEVDENGNVSRSPLTEYAMGKWGEIIPEGVCRTASADKLVQWDIHLYPGGIGAVAPGTMIEDNVVELGIWLHDEDYQADIKQDLASYQLNQGDLLIPPHGKIMTQGLHTFDHPVRIDSFQPHGHLRMNAASLEIFYPETGRTEVVSSISDWSAVWHHSHLFEPDAAPLVPAGAVLIIKQWYDNTADNPNNPDPRQWVAWGQRTADEMTHAWIAVSHLDEETYQELLAERKANENEALAMTSNN